MNFLKTTAKNIAWMGMLTVFTKLLALGKIAILARILSPAQFGTYGIALLVLGFLEVLTETGINIFLIQQRDEIDKYLDSAWVVSILRGLLISLVIIFSIPLVTSFFKSPEAAPLLYLVAGVAFVRGFINPMEVLFQKELDFNKVFVFQGSLYLIDALIAVILASLTHSEQALIIGMVTAAFFEVVISFVIFRKRPSFKLNKERLTEVINSGKWITGAGIFSYVFQNIDNVTVGKLLGSGSLGLYQQSYSIATLPVTGVSDIFNKVMFPYFVKISDSKKEVKSAFIKSIIIIFLLASLFAVILFIFAKSLILIILGPKWLVIEPTLKILTIFGVLKSVLNSTYSLFLSLKMQKAVMFSEFFGILGMLSVIYFLVLHSGTVGAGYSAIVACLCSLPIVFLNVKKIIFTDS